MKVLYYDCFCGISGDMNLAALLDLGVPKEYLIEEISKLKLNSEYEIKIEKAVKHGITGTRVDVILNNQVHNHEHVAEKALDNHQHVHINNDHHEHPHHENHNHSHEHI